MKILESAQLFMSDLAKEASLAKERLYVQAMTFEGDSAGSQLIELMLESNATDKKLVVDCYSKVVINDHFVFSLRYLFSKEYRAEVRNTKSLIRMAQAQGIQVTFTNPVGLFMWKYPLRNHKKMVVVDDIAYLGGINFSDHNFSWHDMMVKLEQEQIASLLSHDIRETVKGRNQSKVENLENDKLYFLNGTRSESEYEILFDQLRSAQTSIDIVSPYISDPLLTILKELDQTVDINIFTPEKNNKGLFQRNLFAENSDGRFNVIQCPGMSHMKAILIDSKVLVFGSSNYDIISYYFEQEVVFQTGNNHLIEEFVSILNTLRVKGSQISEWKGKKPFQLKFVQWFCKIASRVILRPV